MASQMRTCLSNSTTGAVNTSGIFAAHQVGITATRSFSLQLLALPFGAGTGGRGIVPGSAVGPPAEDTTDFNVAGVISNGSRGGQLLYQNDVMNALETIAGGFRIFHEKLFLDQSGASITVTNVGLVFFSNIPPSAQSYLFARDNITIVVPDTSGVVIKYREEWTV